MIEKNVWTIVYSVYVWSFCCWMYLTFVVDYKYVYLKFLFISVQKKLKLLFFKSLFSFIYKSLKQREFHRHMDMP